jgi:hypothetical protein
MFKAKVNPGFLFNPFYLYCISFTLAVLLYHLGWSDLFPELSSALILFFCVTFILFLVCGVIFSKKKTLYTRSISADTRLITAISVIIVILGLVNILYMGYLPILDRSHNYREFGMPVIDPVFNTLSIFFSVVLFHQFLRSGDKKQLSWYFLILFIQIIIFRRSTIIWILVSSSILYTIYKQGLRVMVVVSFVVLIPVFSFLFGFYGNTRSSLKKSFVLEDLGASESFKSRGISYNHYMTYLYLASPIANLQENVDKSVIIKEKSFKDFLFYSIIPESITMRLEKSFNLKQPECHLISPNLLAGTMYMVSFNRFQWSGMAMLFLYLSGFILLCLYILAKWNSFSLETYSILCAMVCLLIFSNFLNRLDVLLMLFVYPVFFHMIFKSGRREAPLVRS